MNRIFLCAVSIFLIANLGCFDNGEYSQTYFADIETVARQEANVKLTLKTEDAGKLRAQRISVAIFELRLINQGNFTSPFTLMRKKADIIDNQATVTFTSVPVQPVMASLILEGANVGSYREFHGGLDLAPGDNTITLVASGVSSIEDANVQAALQAVADYATMQRLSGAVFANINAAASALSPDEQKSADKVLAAFKARVAAAKPLALAAGESHSLVLRDDGTFAAFGSNVYGQLGIQGSSTQLERKFVSFHKIVTQIAAGSEFSLFLTSDGKVYAAGNNDTGQLGITGVSMSAYPVEISGLPAAKSIFAGFGNGFAIDNSDNLYAWGKNSDGQLGIGSISNSELPRQIATNVKQAAAGSNFILILKTDGTVWGAGDNSVAQMAQDIGNKSLVFVQIPGLANVASIAAGSSHCLALKADKTVYAWGANFYGQTGLGVSDQAIESPTLISGLNDIIQIAAGNNHSVARNSAGTLSVFGDNSMGQLANSDTSNNKFSPYQIADPTSVVLLAAGGNHNLVVTTSVFAWGANDAGQLGNGQSSGDGVAVPVERDLTW
ncbi:MAG: hypothetical protein Kow0029_13570 [Candidatus Rifleibacteriota bacterium]